MIAFFRPLLLACLLSAACAENASSKEVALAALFSEVCVASNSSAAEVRTLASSRGWTVDEDREPVEGVEGESSWTLHSDSLGEVRVIVWQGEVSGSPHDLCMVIARADARLLAREIQASLSLPETAPHLEDEGRQEVRYWFFARRDRTNYLEVRQALSGEVAGSASVALGIPLR